MGQGRAPKDAYDTAKKTAAALLAGNMNVPVLSTVNRVFLESCMSVLETINPQFFRLGSGREEPDGSFSFLVRFAGREEGITGELFIRYEERRSAPEPQPPESEAEVVSEEGGDTFVEQAKIQAPVGKTWLFEDLILEEARSREAENGEGRHRFDFSPYERFF